MIGRSSAGAPVRQGFTGYWRDHEAGLNLYYAGARQYSPATGRFFGADPLAEDIPTWSGYTYTLNDPVRWRDPDGRSVNCIYCTMFAVQNMLTAIDAKYEFNSSASVTVGMQVAGVVEISGSKVGFNINAGSLDVMSFNQSNMNLSVTGLTSDMRMQRREFEIGTVFGVSKTETAMVSSMNMSSLRNPQAIEKSTHLGMASYGTVKTADNTSIHLTKRLSMNFAFGLGFRMSVEVRTLANEDNLYKNSKETNNEE